MFTRTLQTRHTLFLLVLLVAMAPVAGAHAEDETSLAVEVGLTPHGLVVAGFSVNDAVIILYRIDTATELRQQLGEQENAVSAVSEQVLDIEAFLLQGSADEDLMTQYASLSAQLEALRSQMQGTRSALRAHALAGFPAAHVQALSVFNAGSRHRVPPALRAVPRTPEQWKSLEQALRAERRAIRRDEDLAQQHQDVLLGERSHPATVAAGTNLEMYLAGMQALFATEG